MDGSTTDSSSVRISHEDHTLECRWSTAHEIIEGVKTPAWMEYRQYGGSDPDNLVRVELRDGSPQVVQLNWISQRHQSEIKQKHLRVIELDSVATDLLATLIAADISHAEDSPDDQERVRRFATKFVERQRMPREYRIITDDFLRSVAQVYRTNLNHAPTKAVAKHFGVRDRMASTYVDRARKAGHLPPTKQGQKKA